MVEGTWPPPSSNTSHARCYRCARAAKGLSISRYHTRIGIPYYHYYCIRLPLYRSSLPSHPFPVPNLSAAAAAPVMIIINDNNVYRVQYYNNNNTFHRGGGQVAVGRQKLSGGCLLTSGSGSLRAPRSSGPNNAVIVGGRYPCVVPSSSGHRFYISRFRRIITQ